jgi:hypothetical protein
VEQAPIPYKVWVLDNLDPNYQSSSPVDTLAVMTDTGGLLWNNEGLGICKTTGAWRAISVAPTGEYALVSEFCRSTDHRLSKLDPSGNLLWHTEIGSVAAVDISDTGFAYVLSGHTIQGTAIHRVDLEEGTTVQSEPYGGVDVVVDDAHDAVWIVGADIKKLSRDLWLEFAIDPVAWTAVSVDTTADGFAWIAVRYQGGLAGELLKVSPEGALVQSIPLTRSPASLAIDRAEDSVWVAMMYPSGGLEKYDGDGNLLLRADTESLAWSVRVSQEEGSAWTAFRDGTVMQLSASGQPLLLVPGAAGDEYRGAWLALGPAGGGDEGQGGSHRTGSRRLQPKRSLENPVP